MKEVQRNGIEIEINNKKKGKRKIYIKVYFSPFEIWIDFSGLPQTALLCAMCDAQTLIQSKCGEKGNVWRSFVNIDWVINEWGGDSEIVEAVKKRRQMILDDLPRLKKDYEITDD